MINIIYIYTYFSYQTRRFLLLGYILYGRIKFELFADNVTAGRLKVLEMPTNRERAFGIIAQYFSIIYAFNDKKYIISLFIQYDEKLFVMIKF